MFPGSGNPGANPFATAFGAPATTPQPTFTAGGFGSTTNTQSTAFGSGGFGAPSTNMQTAPFASGGFGTSSAVKQPAFGSSVFGASATPATQSTTFGSGGFGGSTGATQPPAFGSGGFGAISTANTQPVAFGTGGFGPTATASSQPPAFGSGGFGSTSATSTQPPAFGSGGFGASPTSAGVFGSSATGTQPPAFGSAGFGVSAATTTQSSFGSAVFGTTAANTQPPAFGSTGFGSTTTSTPSFGSTGGFGTGLSSTAAGSATSAGTFGSSSASKPQGSAPSVFGQPAAPSLFQSTASTVFGAPVAPTSFVGPRTASPRTLASTPPRSVSPFTQSASGTSTFPSSPFGTKETKPTPATLAASIFGGDRPFTSSSESVKSLPGSRSSASTGAFSNTSAGLFTNTASALAGSSRFSQRQSATTTTTASTFIQPTSSVTFGGVAGAGKADVAPVFGAVPANKDKSRSVGDVSQSASMSAGGGRPSELLFGKTVTSDMPAPTPDDQPVTQTLFGKPVDKRDPGEKAPPQTLFGKPAIPEKADTGKSSHSPNRRSIQRTGPAESRKKSPPKLFGRAIAAVKKDEKPAELPWRQKHGKEEERDAEEKDVEVSFESRSRVQQRVGPSGVRRKSREDDDRRVGIICKGVPPGCLNKDALRKHFSRFGRVVRVFPNASKRQATIHFDDPKAAAEAKLRGTRMKHGAPEMTIFFSSYRKKESEAEAESPPGKSRSESRESSSSRSELSRHQPSSREKQPPVLKPTRSFKDEVDEELESMMGTRDITSERVKILRRPQDDASKEKAAFSRHESSRSSSPTPGHSSGSRESKTRIDRKRPDDRSPTRGGSSGRRETVQSQEPSRPRSVSPTSAIRGGNRESKSQIGKIKSEIDRPPRPRSASPSHTREHSHKSQVMKVKEEESKSQRPRSMSPTYQRERSPARQTTKPGTESVSLRSLANTVAQSSTDRLAVLETVDKLVKQAIDAQTSTNLAHVMVGTCPDMCPEKERYLRECRRLLTPFESIPGSDAGQGPSVDHVRAVKEYSRSSADQDMPLPHELRPSPVLDIAMIYLLNNIMDLGGDGKWENWYEFMWNRTRAIRKDITQQALCDLTTVGLVEKCARFHIYCAELLCEEDFNVFDATINNENLTKCLQTLKELYADLEKKEVTCPNEVEFRAYLVLMNLNEGDILRQVQQLPSRIRQSPVMKLVIKVHAALYNMNYVRFFKLVRQANFLQASILHRYFGQVRQRALLTMIKVYSTPSKGYSCPLSDLVRLLAFEDETEARDFCLHHGLMCEEGQVLLERQSFVQPELAFAPRRAMQLIETKQTASAGEIVNGEPLPPNILHQPTMSFDDQGRFQTSRINIPVEIVEATHGLEIQGRTEAPAPQPGTSSEVVPQVTALQVAPPAAPHPAPPSVANVDTTPAAAAAAAVPVHPSMLAVPNEIVKEIAKNLFIEVIHEMCFALSTSFVRLIQMVTVANNYVVSDLLSDATQPMIKRICEDVYQEVQEEEKQKEEEKEARIREEARKREEEARSREAEARRRAAEAHDRRLKELAQIRESACHDIIEEISDEVATEQGKVVAQEVSRDVERQLQKESRDRSTAVVADELISVFVGEEMTRVFDDFYRKEVVERREKLASIERAVELIRISKFFKQWKDALIGRQRLKRSMLTFPPAPSLESPQEQLKTLIPDSQGITPSSMHLGKTARLTIEAPNQVLSSRTHLINNMAAYRYLLQAQRQLAWAPLDVGSCIGKRVVAKYAPQTRSPGYMKEMDVYWKLMVGLPELVLNKRTVDDMDTAELCKWMTSKLKRGAVSSDTNDAKSELLSAYSQRIESARPANLHISIRAACGCLGPSDVERYYREGHFAGTSAVILALNIPEEEENMKDWWLEERLRLTSLFEAKPALPSIPVAVIARHTGSHGPMDKLVEKELTLPLLVANDAVSTFKVFEIDDLEDLQTSQLLSTALSWLAEECPEQPDIAAEPLVDFIENALTREFYGPVYQNLATRRRTGYLDQAPDLLVCLYNHLIQHLKDTASSPQLVNISWPVVEFIDTHPELPDPGWNTKSIETIADLILDMTLPEFEITNSGDWDAACTDVWAFIATVTEDSPHTDIKLSSRVRWLLRQARSDFDDLCWLVDNADDHQPFYVNLPWTDIILACIDHQITKLKLTISRMQEEDGKEVRVHYWPNDLSSYVLPSEWLASTKVKHPAQPPQDDDEERLETTVSRATKRKLSDPAPVTPPVKVICQELQHSRLDLSAATPTELEASDKAHRLRNELAMEKRKVDKFEEYLLQALDGGTDPQPHSTTFSPIRRDSEQQFIFDHTHAFTPFRTPQPTRTQTVVSPPVRRQSHSIEEGILDLKAAINSQRQADKLYEMKLQALLVTHSFDELS